jgi:hypothetical protein
MPGGEAGADGDPGLQCHRVEDASFLLLLTVS